ncbi:MAG: hypothetical protein GOU98_05010 [Candidatus Altiarchaeota archaeon]|nr:hypothetical protein [Candidatus Altiarchaeota archaeon]
MKIKQKINYKEIAKFLSGVAAWEAIAHAYLWSSGMTLVVFGFTFTKTLNFIQAVVSATTSGLLAYYAWIWGKNK